MLEDLEGRLRLAVKHFWSTRESQAARQGAVTGVRDQGARSAVTGGKQMDGFVDLVKEILVQCGVAGAQVYCDKKLELPGYYRSEKKWDLVVVIDGTLLACLEFKSQIGPSFGNNFNNRTEEAIGTASDIWAAYREGAFKSIGGICNIRLDSDSSALVRTRSAYGAHVHSQMAHREHRRHHQEEQACWRLWGIDTLRRDLLSVGVGIDWL